MRRVYGTKWWDKSFDQLEREVKRLQNICKHEDKYARATVEDARRRLPNLKAILAARRGTPPLFPKGIV